ncbi:unnamed protein product [Rhizoctonia solani]|uniref:Uncharacterized protein n=1 Tax=Rhizoctonia solani TaxID=456999 RepID=A0A8H2XDI8_9AGAM|nr:unnamed protein product [Rhizoctonia solani]
MGGSVDWRRRRGANGFANTSNERARSAQALQKGPGLKMSLGLAGPTNTSSGVSVSGLWHVPHSLICGAAAICVSASGGVVTTCSLGISSRSLALGRWGYNPPPFELLARYASP